VDGTLRLLAGNGVGELVFIDWMMGCVVPASLGRGRATKYKIGGPRVGRRAVGGVVACLRALGQPVGRERQRSKLP